MQKQVRVKSVTTEKGETGQARLIRVGVDKARIKFSKTENEFLLVVKQGEYDEEGVTVPKHVPFSDIPLPKDNKASGLSINATMTLDGKRLLYASPWSQELEVKFIGFKSKDEKTPPTPVTHKGKDNKPFSNFTPILEVVEGGWKSLRYYIPLYLNFGTDTEGMLVITGGDKRSDNLSDFGDCIGVHFNSIPYSENPLPEIESKAVEGKTFKIRVEAGWIDSYSAGFGEELVNTEEIGSDDYQDSETSELKEENRILSD